VHHLVIPGAAALLAAGALFTAANGQGKESADKGPGAVVNKDIAVLETSLGTFEIELYRGDAPKTVENFVKLAGQKYFDGQRFHRVSKNFVIQAGDELSKDTAKAAMWGTGGRSIYGKEFADELNPGTASYKEGYRKGVVAMANRGPNTNTSQFFVMLRDNPGMPKNYTIFGKVVKGLDVVEKIGQAEVTPNMSATDGRPKTDILIRKVTVRTEGGK
jgi:cyclophilin family peptidyl-prolyl cis-trans isomerase